MLTAAGSFTRAVSDFTAEVITGLGFAPASVWFLVTETSTLDATLSIGVLAGDATAAQISQAAYLTEGISTSSTGHARESACLLIRKNSGTEYQATGTLEADGFTVTPSTADVTIDVRWFATDSDAAVGVALEKQLGGVGGTWPIFHDGAAFTPVFAGSFGSRPDSFNKTASNAGWGFEIGSTALGYISANHFFRTSQSSHNSHSGLYDTNIDAGAGTARNLSGISNLATIDASYELNGALDALDVVVIEPGQTDSRWKQIIGFGVRGSAAVTFGRFSVPDTDSVLSITGLGFEPKFILGYALVGDETPYSGSDELPRLFVGIGPCVGIYTAQAQYSKGFSNIPGSSATLVLGENASFLNFASPYTGTGNVTATNADGFDITFAGLDGTQHQVVWVAFGEPGTGEDELDADAVTLAWSSQDVGLSSTQILDADDLTLAWASQEVDITSGSTLDVDPVTLGWSSLDAALEAFSVVDGVPSMFNWTAELASITVAEEVLDVDSLTLAWVAQEADVIPAGVVGPEPLTLAWSSGLAGLVSEEQALSIENALLSFASQTAVVLDDANVVSPSDGIFAWMATDVVIANEQVNPEACAFGWTASNANIFPELEERHAHTVDVVRPDSMTVEVYSTNRRTKSGTT